MKMAVDPIKLKEYIRTRRSVPLMDILNHFKTEKSVVEPMLKLWIEKGKLRQERSMRACKKGCCRCDPATVEFYEWIG